MQGKLTALSGFRNLFIYYSSISQFVCEENVHEATGEKWFSEVEIKQKRAKIAAILMRQAEREHKRKFKFPPLKFK